MREIVGLDTIAFSTREQLPIHLGVGQPLIPHFGAWPFSGRANSVICSYCFSTSHSSRDCKLKSGSNPSNHSVSCPPFKMESFSNQAPWPLCFDSNEIPAPARPHPACHFDHIYYYCVHNTTVKDKSHKAICYPHRASTNGPRPTLGIRHWHSSTFAVTALVTMETLQFICISALVTIET